MTTKDFTEKINNAAKGRFRKIGSSVLGSSRGYSSDGEFGHSYIVEDQITGKIKLLDFGKNNDIFLTDKELDSDHEYFGLNEDKRFLKLFDSSAIYELTEEEKELMSKDWKDKIEGDE